jgi:serine/threonine protein kinase
MIAVTCPGCGVNALLDGEGKGAVCAQCGHALPTADRTVAESQVSSLPGEERVPSPPPGGAAATANITAAPKTDEASHDSAELCACLAPPQEPGELGRLGNYRVLRIVGSGGMGVVFEAEDVNLKRRVALKALLPNLGASSTARKRFLREARAAADVESDHVVSIYQIGEDRGVPFLAMQFLKGETLEDRARREPPLPMSEIVRIGREMALGLDAAHARGLVHRDVKPSNTWLEAGSGRVKILDFGLARNAGEESDVTRLGAILGTPAYMSSEQARGLSATPRSDLFSLGSVLYRLCTGRQPFKGNGTVDTLMAVATETPPPPRELNPAVPAALDSLITHLMAKEPGDRPGSARDVAHALSMIDPARPAAPSSVRTVPVPPVPAAPPAPHAPARHRGWLIAAWLVVLALGLFLFGNTLARRWHTEPARPSPETTSPFDRLDPAALAASDHIPGLERELVAVFGPHGGPSVQGVEISRDGSMLLTLGLRLDAHLWDVESGTERTSFTCRRAVFAPDGKSLIVAQADSLRLIDLDGKEIGSVPVPAETEVIAVDIGPDGRSLVWGGKQSSRKKLSRGEGIVHLWDLAEHKDLGVFPSLPHPVYGVRYSPDGKRIAAMSADRSVYIWQVATRKETKFEQPRGMSNVSAMLHSMRASLIDYTPDGRTLAFGRRATVHIVNLEAGTEVKLGGFGSNVHSLAYSPDGKKLAVGDAKGAVVMFDTAGNRLHEWQMPGVVNDVTFAPDGRHLAVANFNGTVTVLRLGE